MRECTFELDFKSEMSNIEIEGVESIVKNLKYNDGDFSGEIEYGFVYTSSSSYAMISVHYLYYTNEDGEELEVSHFAITQNNMLIMICEDDTENYYYYEIEPKDFY